MSVNSLSMRDTHGVRVQHVMVQTESITFISIARSLEFCGCLLIIFTRRFCSHVQHNEMNDEQWASGMCIVQSLRVEKPTHLEGRLEPSH